MNELSFQKNLIDAARREGGSAYKTSHRSMVGVADLMVQIPGLPTVMIECKFKTMLPHRGNTPVAYGLTHPQAKFLHDVRSAGGYAGVCVLFIDSECQHHIFVDNSDSFSVSREEFFKRSLTRKRGDPWPIRKICETLVQ